MRLLDLSYLTFEYPQNLALQRFPVGKWMRCLSQLHSFMTRTDAMPRSQHLYLHMVYCTHGTCRL
jgi:hypothetical protein